ncbi:MAG: 3-deoxy-manno-octulosonate cytidylyltransferase [Betaproteobacteria bacterium]|nr:3-deoxy-manno-octulosonate cytidylyltransferase [Betaproteobacteria bacterium]
MSGPRGGTGGFTVIIPARYASTRLPAKALADIGGKPMVIRVAERAAASGASAVWIATDHDAIAAAADAHGVRVIRSQALHASGTDRIAEAARLIGLAADDIVVNVQGDEPQMPPRLVQDVARQLANAPDAAMATACHPIEYVDEFLNPNVVKAVLDAKGFATYFSRAPIPYPRDRFASLANAASQTGVRAKLPAETVALRHLGIYAYRVSFLARYAALSAAPTEQLESLEQLRVLWHGFRIAVSVTDHAPPAGVDTPEDLARVRRAFDDGK